MIELLQILFSFPTIIYTVLLGFAMIFGLLTVMGIIASEVLDAVFGLDDIGGDFDSGGNSGFSGFMRASGLAGIPLTIVGMFVIAWSWIFSVVLMLAANRAALPEGFAVKTVVGIGALLLGGFFGALSLRPFRNVFTTQTGKRKGSLVGKSCTVRSIKVDGDNGRAEIDDGASGILAEVRCELPNSFTVGSKAIVSDYDPRLEIFQIVPADSVEAMALSIKSKPARRSRRGAEA